MGYAERGALLHGLADLIAANAEELALADATDMGKPISDARTRTSFAAAAPATSVSSPTTRGCHAAESSRWTAATTPTPASSRRASSPPIAPWNFPLMLESWKVAPALAWGNTVVLKPAEDTPASASLLARLAPEAGLPPGVLNVVHGYGPDSAGAALTEHPAVDRITFTGESATGRVIARAARPT